MLYDLISPYPQKKIYKFKVQMTSTEIQTIKNSSELFWLRALCLMWLWPFLQSSFKHKFYFISGIVLAIMSIERIASPFVLGKNFIWNSGIAAFFL